MAKKGEKGLQYKLSVNEQKFVAYYIECGNSTLAVKKAGFRTNAPATYARKLLAKPKIQAELNEQMKALKQECVATAEEIRMFYTSVMRGQEKDQFGLDLTMSDRLKAAEALAKRQIDMQEIADKADAAKITVSLVFDRKNDAVEPDISVEEDEE